MMSDSKAVACKRANTKEIKDQGIMARLKVNANQLNIICS
jgi:hypothetical protein